MNSVAGYFLYSTDSSTYTAVFLTGLSILIAQNISFAFTVLKNPGLPSRDISVHTTAYLNKVKILR